MDWDNTFTTSNGVGKSIPGDNYRTNTTTGAISQRISSSTHIGRRSRQLPGKGGKIPNTPLRRARSYVRQSRVYVAANPTIRRNGNYKYTILPARPPYYTGLGYFTSDAAFQSDKDRSITECMARLADQKVQLMNDLIDAKRTLNMLANSASQAARALIAVRRGHWKQALTHVLGGNPRVPRTYANRWLEFAYGWEPLAKSVHDYQEALKSKTDSSHIIRVAREIKRGGSTSAPTSESGHYFDCSLTVDFEHSVKTVLYAKIHLDYLQQAKQWGVTNPAGIAWEALPYSFVVDWFVPVGNVLSAWGATAGLGFLTGSVTRRETAHGSGSMAAISPYTYHNKGTVETKSSVTLSQNFMSREALLAFPRPTPYFKNPFSTRHVASALALIAQTRR